MRRSRIVLATTTDSRIYRLAARYRHTRCSYCRPNRGENANRKDRDRRRRLLARYGAHYFCNRRRYRPLI